jgi:ferritin-like metal-binding protein YciE
MTDVNARDAKLIQYLNEAYGKEKELERALEGHIQMTTRAPYRKRLQEHLRETKSHANVVSRRIKQLGGRAEEAPGPAVIAGAAGRGRSVVHQAAALAKGAAQAVRGTGEQEKMLKNAKTEIANEAEEIANYTALETLAQTVGDRETASLVRDIRRQEERMLKFLERLIPQLTQAVVRDEIPAPLRNGAAKRRSARSSGRSSSRSRASSARRPARSAGAARSKPASRAGTTRRATSASARGTARRKSRATSRPKAASSSGSTGSSSSS